MKRQSSAESAGLRQLEFMGQYHIVEGCSDLERKSLKYSAKYSLAHSVMKLPKTMGSKERKTTPKRITNSTLPLPTQVAIRLEISRQPSRFVKNLVSEVGKN